MNNLYSKTKFYLFHSFIPFLLVFTPHRAHCPSSWGNTPPLGSSPSSTVRIRMTLPTLNPACVIWNEVVINRRKRTHFTCWAFLLVFFFFFQWDNWCEEGKKRRSNHLYFDLFIEKEVPFKRILPMKEIYSPTEAVRAACSIAQQHPTSCFEA